MGFSDATAKIWPVTPDWTNNITEKLGWSTEVLKASATGVSQHRGLKVLPDRSLTFEALAQGKARRLADMLLASWSGEWALPIWPDVQWLGTSLAAGADGIDCATAGYDFVQGGNALLFDDATAWEIVQIQSVVDGSLAFSAPTTVAHGPGSRLYPLRRARAQDGAQETLRNDDVSRRSITFDIVEACDFQQLADPVTYLGHLVLDARPDETTDPTASYNRMSQMVDYGTSIPLVYDLPNFAFRAHQTSWKLWGRELHTWFRSLLYTLQGMRVPIWVPSHMQDFKPTAPIAGNQLHVEWAGYTQWAQNQRKDLRIELNDGTVFYRRITAAAEASLSETLTLDSALGVGTIDPSAVRLVSFLSLSTLASDEVEIDHVTDAEGVATATTGWSGIVPDV